MAKSFGEFVKEKRLQQDLSLRKFCEKLNYDPSNWSKIERGLLSAPNDYELLTDICSILNFENESEDWFEFMDLAAISQKQIPHYIINDPKILELLPAFYRAASSTELTDEKLEKLVELLKKVHSSEG